MASDPLIEELLSILGQPDNINAHFKNWRQRCAQHLQSLPESKRRSWLENVQRILAENRALYTEESQVIFDTLVQTPPSPRRKAQAKRYRTVGDL
ncbi:hypothetical protein [Saccharospirillum sp. MSK14-1]|uniref:hypothetical protein n=1 Tax=Saccharospirillum sp. MSK14-1 TaxID=1897632 RepID=UPI0011B297B0|nr:hypothetical protein [Saccharospirillum sp. MSK14-1]